MTDAETAPAGRLPNFLVIGATKAGSTSVCAYLREHPQVFLHHRKELRFFSAPHVWSRGPDWYAEQFAEAGDAVAVGEASNAYTRHPAYPGVPERAASVVPHARLIYLVREPFTRLESHYRWRLSTGYEWRPVEEALVADPSYVAASLYGLQLAEWLRFYPPESLLVIRCEQLFTEPKALLMRVCEHLGVEFDPRQPFRRENPTHERRAVAGVLRRLSKGRAGHPMRRLGKRIANGGLGLGASAADAEYGLPQELHAEIAALFEEDRRLLREIAGPEVARWPQPHEAVRPERRLRRVPGFAEKPAGWLGAELGLTPAARDDAPEGAHGEAEGAE